MSDVNANINISIDSSKALGQLRALQSQISSFNQSVIAGNAAAAQSQRSLNSSLAAQIGATKAFSTSMVNVESSVSRLGSAIDKNKLSLGEYFRYGTAASGKFGRGMKEHAAIMELAGDRVKRLQTQYVAMGQAHNGMTRAMAIRPLQLHNADAAIGIQRQQIFNKLMHDGSTSMVNWGKNTQWAGRQLMVGFTVPLTIFGGVAGKIFMDLEKQIVQFKRVYGDLQTTSGEKSAMLEEVKALGAEFTKYGIAVNDTIALAAKAAATGATGADLIAQTTEATRLATLGQIDYEQALSATISLQTAFKVSSEDLAQTTDFLNAVENQTVTSLDDITSAIPLVAPVIRGLGGDVKDLAIFMTAMREGGVSANEGANALKSGLASLINPTKAARDQLALMKIDIDGISDRNKGDIQGFVLEFGEALNTLGKFERQQTLAKVFGKYQFARMGALFSNISKEGSQAQRVVDLTTASVKELAALSEGELAQLEEAVGVKFTAAVEKLKLAIAPIGEAFLKIATPLIEFATMLADKFNSLPDGMKTFITWGVAIGGVVIPAVVMLVGLFANFLGQMIKMGNAVRMLLGKTRGLGSALQYLSGEEIDAMAASTALEGQTHTLTSALNTQRGAVLTLARAYGYYTSRATAAAVALPQGFRGPAGKAPKGYARGGIVPGSGNKDTVPAVLTPGESVITKDATKKYGPVLAAMNAGTLPGFAEGYVDIGNGERIMLNVSQGGYERNGTAFGSAASIQRLFDSAASMGDDIRNDFIAILRSLETQTKVSASTVKDLLRQSARPELRGLGTSGVRYSYPGNETPEAQMARDASMSTDQITREIRAAEVSAAGAVSAVQNSPLLNGDTDPRARTIESGIARSHTQNVSKSLNGSPDLAAWHANFWQMQSQAENQFLETGLKQSTTNQEFLKRYLGEQQEATDLMARATSGVALTEADWQRLNAGISNMLEDVQRTPQILQESGVSKTFLKQAIGSKGAYDARVGAGLSYGAPRSTVGMSDAELEPIRRAAAASAQEGQAALRDGWGTNSPSRVGAEIAEEVPRGVAVGIERATPVATAAAREMAMEVKGQLAMDFDDGGLFPADNFVGKRKLKNIGPSQRDYSEAYLMNAQIDAQRRRAGATSNGSRVNPTRIDMDAASQGAMGAVMSGTGKTLKDGPIDPEVPKKLSEKMRGMTGKIMAGGMAMDGLLFGMSMMDNGVGEFAQKIMPAAFALQGVSMMLPLLSNPVGIAIAAVAALGAGVFLLNKQTTDLAARGKQLADAMYGTTKSMQETAAFFGRETWEDRVAETRMQTETGETVTTENTQKAVDYMQSDAGKGLLENIRVAMDTLGSDKAAKALQNNLQRMMLSGAIAPEMGSAIAAQIGEQLGNQQITFDAVSNMTKIVGPDGKNLTNMDGRLKIVADIVGDVTSLKDSFEQAGILWDQSGWWVQATMSIKGEGTQDLFADAAIQEATNKLNIYQQEIDRLTARWKSGKINAEQYQIATKKIFADKAGALSYGKMLEDAAFGFGDDWDAAAKNKFDQGFVDNLMEFVKSTAGLGQKAGEEFLDGLRMAIDYGNGYTDSLNLLDPDKVSQAIVDLKAMGQGAQAANVQENYEAIMNLSLKIESGEIDGEVIQDMLDGGLEAVDIVAKLQVKYGSPEATAIMQMATGNLKQDGFALDIITNYVEKGDLEKAGFWLDRALRGKALGVSLDVEMRLTGNSTLLEKVEEFDAMAAKKKTPVKRIVNFASNNFGMVKGQIDGWAKLSDSEKKTRTMVWTEAYLTAREDFVGSGALQQLKNAMGVAGTWSGDDYLTNTHARTVANTTASSTGSTSTGLDDSTGSDTGGGGEGGGTKEDPLKGYKDMWAGLKETLKMYTNIENVLKKLKGKKDILEKALKSGRLGFNNSLVDDMRAAGLSEMFIADLVSKGYKEAKKIFETLKKRGKLDVANRAMLIGGAGQTVSNNRKSIRENQAQLGANDKLKGLGTVSDEARLSIANDPAKAQQFLALWKNAKNGVEGADKKVKQFIKSEEIAVAKAKELADALEPPQSDSEIYSDASKAIMDAIDHEISLIENRNALLFETENGRSPEALEQAIETRNAEIKVLQHLVSKVEDLNESDQDRIDALSRQKEMIQRQIEVLERANEMDQRKIENLRREDELRSRAADSINNELEAMSRQEAVIRDAYAARIEALDEIRKLNDHILQSQQDQLNIGKALSQGDVYAAAEAAAQMQSNQVQYAGEMSRTGLEQGMENAVNGLTTSSGMTREQAEAQLNALKDASYQTSLLIRDIEDQIYARTQQMIPLKDQQYQLDLQSQAIQDIIYNRNLEQKDIYQAQIDALTLKNEQEQFLLDKLDLKNEKDTEAMEAKKGALEREIDLQNSSFTQIANIRDMTDKAKDKAIELANQWGTVASNALSAASAIAAAAGANAVPVNRYTGGMIEKFATGNVVGDGGRDTVSAMLTPGEFVVRKAAVEKYGQSMFEKINTGSYSIPKYSAGGATMSMPNASKAGNTANINAPVYNSYSVNVTANTNSSADDIARTVIAKIKTIESSNIRRVNGY